jgi:predicted lipase
VPILPSVSRLRPQSHPLLPYTQQTYRRHFTTRVITDTSMASLVFVGFDPNSDSVVVGHQGTDPSKVKSLLVDADFVLQPMDSKIFPGLPSGIETHGGFQEAHARSASQILQAVQSELAARNTNNVLVVGHSLGGALALLDCVFLKLKLPSTIQLKGITFGMPRVSPSHHGYQ